jgi:two-component system, sensor histidine kinase LadS
MKFISILILLTMLFITSVNAKVIDIAVNSELSLLENSQIYIDYNNLTIHDILNNKLFKVYDKSKINTGLSNASIWLKFELYNSKNAEINKVIVLNSPILENIIFYEKNDFNKPKYMGTAHLTDKHSTLFPRINVQLAAKSSKEYYFKINSNFSPVSFAVTLEDSKSQYKKDLKQQLIDTLLVGVILSLALYSFLLYFYTKNITYFYYSLYLGMLIYQQVSYVGLLQIHAPLSIAQDDYYLALFKVAGLVITSSLFAMHFLKTKNSKKIHKIYKSLIVISTIEIFLHYTFGLVNLKIVVFTSILFIIFNLVAAIVIYKDGNKQARLFIAGFSVVFFSYAIIILDTLGLSELMHNFPNLVSWATAIEALILSLAFADQYTLLQEEKNKVDKKVLIEVTNREEIIKGEVVKKTQELNKALRAKELLLQEVHHRVKNNLQIILSIIRLQNDDIDDDVMSEKFINLENRINAITKTYNMLLIGNNLHEVDMAEYVESLVLDIKESMFNIKDNLEIITDIKAFVPLKKSVYLGLIINELVINSYKHAFDNAQGTIKIFLNKDNDNFVLIVEDNGKGFNIDVNNKSLGLRLINTLVNEQLEGTIEHYNNRTKNVIRFHI